MALAIFDLCSKVMYVKQRHEKFLKNGESMNSKFAYVFIMMILGFGIVKAGVDKSDFIGEFKIQKSIYGMCDSGFVAMTSPGPGGVDLHLGSFRFMDVDGGNKVIDDELVKLTYNTVFNGKDRITSKTTSHKKNSGSTEIEEKSATIKAGKLHIKSHFVSKTPGESDLEFTTECDFVKMK